MIVAVLLLSILGLAISILVAVDKLRPAAAVDPVLVFTQQILETQYGRELSMQNGQIIVPPTVDHWFVKLRAHQAYDPGNDGVDYSFLSDLVIKVQDGSYFHVLIRTSSDGRQPPSFSSSEPIVTALTELRARRALFNDAQAYEKAFGEKPSRAQIQRMQQSGEFAETDSVHD